jgi:hypothetical protein
VLLLVAVVVDNDDHFTNNNNRTNAQGWWWWGHDRDMRDGSSCKRKTQQRREHMCDKVSQQSTPLNERELANHIKGVKKKKKGFNTAKVVPLVMMMGRNSKRVAARRLAEGKGIIEIGTSQHFFKVWTITVFIIAA